MAATNVTPISRADIRRAGWLRAGTHGPISIRVDLIGQHDLETYYHIKVDYPGQVGATIEYVGHREDLVAAHCISPDMFARVIYGHFCEIGCGLVVISSKACRGKRGWIEVGYYTVDRTFADSLPGLRELFPEGLPRTAPPDRDAFRAWLSRRPRLRLVVDNVRVRPMSADNREPEDQATLRDKGLMVLGYISVEEYERREREARRQETKARLRLVVDNTRDVPPRSAAPGVH